MIRAALCGVGAVVLAAASSSASRAQTVERDLAYGPDSLQRLDLWAPHGTGFPTVIFVHGGSLSGGDKEDEDYGRVCAPFPAAGMACASVDYRLAPAHRWPAPAEDVAAAVAWVGANIGARGGDPHELFLFGHSSGAMLVALVASDPRYLARHGLTTDALRGALPMGSIMWDLELDQALARHGRARVEAAFAREEDGRTFGTLDAYQDHWPIHHLRAHLPPFLFLIADSERVHPPVLETDSTFAARARALGSRAEYRVLPGRTHYRAIRELSEPNDAVFAIIRDFVRAHSSAASSP